MVAPPKRAKIPENLNSLFTSGSSSSESQTQRKRFGKKDKELKIEEQIQDHLPKCLLFLQRLCSKAQLRFTQIQKMRPPPPSPQEVRAQIASNQQSTQQNRRLAQQMANRPAVQAALGQGQGRQQNKQVSGFPAQQKSLKQRLGPSNVKARLSLGNGVVRGGGRGIRRGSSYRGGRGQQGSGRGGQYIMNGGPVRGGNRGRGRGRGISNRGQQFSPPRWRDNDRYPRGRGGFGRPGDNSFRGRGGSRGRGGDRGRGGQRGSFRGRGGRGGPRGRGRGGNVQNYSKEQLDNQLEEYMSKSKSHLNQELDDYMAQADN